MEMTFRERIFPTWIKLTSVNHSPKRRYTDRGRLIQTGTVICGVIGLDTDLSFVYQLFALLICVLIASRLSLRFQRPKITLSRRLPPYATVGKSFEYSFTLINGGDRVEKDLSITDNPKIIPPTLEQFRHAKEPGEETRNAYDRWIGWHRFIWLQRVNTGITISTSKSPDVPIKGNSTTTMTATPLRRGMVHLESTTVLHPDPFTLNYGVIRFKNYEQLIVLPRRYPVSKNFEFLDQCDFHATGVNSSWSVGESDEFVSLRDYRNGDPIRKIHWPSTARRALPIIKEFQDELFSRKTIVVDTFAQDSEIFEEVISVTASLLTAFHESKAPLDLCFMSDRTEIVEATLSHANISKQLEALALLEKTTSQPEELINSLTTRSKMISNCILVFAGMDSKRQRIIQAIESQDIPTAIFVVKHAKDQTVMREDYKLLEIGRIEEGLANL